MAEIGRRIFGSNLICICVDETINGDYKGTIWNQYEENGRPFENAMDLLQKMDDLLDELHFPERSNMPREFGKEQKRYNDAPKIPGERVMHADCFEDKDGKIATFIARIKFRQKSTWQGEILWLEKDERVEFISALEMTKLIDRAVSS